MGISVAYWLRANTKGFQKIVLFNLLVLAYGQTITDPIIPTGNGSLIGTTISIPINTTSNIGTNQTYPSTAITEAIQNNSSFTTLRTTTDYMITTGNDSLSEPTTSIPINATSDVGINQTDPSTPITEATTNALMITGNDSLIEPTTSIPINATSDIETNQTYPSTPTIVTEATTEQGQETVCDGEIQCVVTNYWCWFWLWPCDYYMCCCRDKNGEDIIIPYKNGYKIV